MEQNQKNVVATPDSQNEAANKNTQKRMTPEEAARAVSRGKMRLFTPIRASDRDVDVLEFDFTKLTGWEFAQALDRDDSGKTNAFRLTGVQALELFAAAVHKMTPDVDAEDIRYRMGIEDAIKATQLATAFFNLTSRAANSRITG